MQNPIKKPMLDGIAGLTAVATALSLIDSGVDAGHWPDVPTNAGDPAQSLSNTGSGSPSFNAAYNFINGSVGVTFTPIGGNSEGFGVTGIGVMLTSLEQQLKNLVDAMPDEVPDPAPDAPEAA